MEIKILKYCRELRRGVASTLISCAVISSAIPMQACGSDQMVGGMQSVVAAPESVSTAEINPRIGENQFTTSRTEQSDDAEKMPVHGENSPHHSLGRFVAGLAVAGFAASTVTLGVLYGQEVNNNSSYQEEIRNLQYQVSALNQSNEALGTLAKSALLDTAGSYNSSVIPAPVARRLQEMGVDSRRLQGESLIDIIKSLTDSQVIAIMPLIEGDFLRYVGQFSRPNLVTGYTKLVKTAKDYLSNNCASLVNSQKQQCAEGEFYGVSATGVSTCLTCPDDNAKACMITNNGTAVQSTACRDGYFLDAYNICTKCVTANCASCNSDGSCNYCVMGFYNNNGVCSPCNQAIPGCRYCSSATKCIACFDQGQYISTNGSSCTSCSSIIPGCNVCKSDSLIGYTTCASCNKVGALGGLFVHPTGLQCNSCSRIIANCQTCKEIGGKTLCVTCTNSNYNYLSQNQNKCDICQNIIPGCTTCSGSATTPTICNACDSSKSLFLSTDSTKCSTCSDRYEYCTSCVLNGNQPICVSCMNTLYPNALNRACLPCGLVIGQCTSCNVTNSGVTQCSSCGADPVSGTELYVSSNLLSCVPCSTLVANCQTCSSTGSCTKCNSGFNLNLSGACDDKTSLSLGSSTGGFVGCSLFATVSGVADTFGLGIVCASCDSGSRLSGGACVACTPSNNCRTCDSNNNCTSCEPGNFLNFLSPQRICAPCGSNCLSCTSSTSCITCNTGYKLESGACNLHSLRDLSVKMLNSEITSGVVIIDCGRLGTTNYYPTVGNGDCGRCDEIIQGCASCTVSAKTYVTLCSSCQAGKMLSSDASSCINLVGVSQFNR